MKPINFSERNSFEILFKIVSVCVGLVFFILYLVIFFGGFDSETPDNLIDNSKYAPSNYSNYSSKLYSEQKYYTDPYEDSGELHFDHMPLSYKKINCINEESKKIDASFSEIETQTNNLVLFYEDPENLKPDFVINCYKNRKTTNDGGYMLGESGGWTRGKVLLNITVDMYGIVDVYMDEYCSYPSTEIHEILHGFGFEHVDNAKNIMNPIKYNCPELSDSKDVIEKLIKIYS